MTESATALVIDDEKQIRKLFRIVLEEEHYHVLESETGKQGILDAAGRNRTLSCLTWGCRTWTGWQF